MQLINNLLGFTELIIIDDCDFDDFYNYAAFFEKFLNVEFKAKIDDFDSLYWEFKFRDSILILSYSTFLGIRVYPKEGKNASIEAEKNVVEIQELLKNVD